MFYYALFYTFTKFQIKITVMNKFRSKQNQVSQTAILTNSNKSSKRSYLEICKQNSLPIPDVNDLGKTKFSFCCIKKLKS